MFDPKHSLKDKVALVTGASRGAGRGIAAVLGEAGATVYVTGRTISGAPSSAHRPETIDQTAELVTARGGHGIAARCDHTALFEAEALFQRIREEQGRLDILVNNAWGGYEHYDARDFTVSFWDAPLRFWNGMFTAGVYAHYLAARFAAPLMIAQQSGLIISTVAWDEDKFLGNVLYDTAKAAIVRMVRGMARNLQPYGVTVLALACGFMRTESVMAAHAAEPFDLSQTESPEYAGRAVAALAADPHVLRRTGGVYATGRLAEEYNFTDIDGRRVPPFVLPDLYRWEWAGTQE